MGEKNTASKKKPILIVLSVLLVVVVGVFVATKVIGKDGLSKDVSGNMPYAEDFNDEENITSPGRETGVVVAGTNHNTIDGSDGMGITESNVPSDPSGSVTTTEGSGALVTTTTTTKTTTTTGPNGRLPENSPSKLLKVKGAIAKNRWKVSNVISKVVAERVSVRLPVYENGRKTTETVRKTMYIAVINTKPSRVVIPASNQFTNYKLNYLDRFIRGYENKTHQDVLFAVNNEMCARDIDNLSGNVFYNGNDTLTATVIKNSRIAQSGEASAKSLTINKNGTWEYPVRVSMSNCNQLINSGVIASVSYTYPVIWEGRKYNHPESGVNSGIWTDHTINDNPTDLGTNKTLIGKVSDDKYVVMISQGFGSGYLAEFMLNKLNVQYAYWANGGASSTMYIKGYGIVTPSNYFVHGDMFAIR